MSIIFKVNTYSDVAYVEGVVSKEKRKREQVSRALQNHCKRYFDENYRGVFFVGNEYKDEIFHEAFIKLWENIDKRKIYVEDGILKGKGGEPFSGKLTTYFMSIARLKYLEWTKQNRRILSIEEKMIRQKVDIEMIKTILYDSDDEKMVEIIADCISHTSERCNQILTMFYYKEKTLDDIMAELPSFESKNALKTAKYKCMETLRKTANEIYQRYLNS